jgi:RND family efflux transporter MFP subunit
MIALLRRSFWLLLGAGLPALLMVVGSGCGKVSSAAPPPLASASTETPAVTTVHPERQTIRRTIEQPGQIVGFEETPVHAKISGHVRKLFVDIGDPVKAGQTLAELWVPEVEEELHQKEAAVILAQAGIVQAQRALKAAEASLHKSEATIKLAEAGKTRAEASLIRWHSEYERVQRMLRSQAADQQMADQTLDQLKSAEAAKAESAAGIQTAEAAKGEAAAQRDRAEADVQVAEAKLKVAEADRAHAAAVLEYAHVKAPFDGVVTRRMVDTGRLLDPSSGPLFHVVRTDPVRIFVDVPEADAAQVHVGTPAVVRVQALQDQEFTGKVSRFSWALDAQTRTLRAQIDLPNKEGILRPGAYATARLSVERPNVVTVLASAVLTQNDPPLLVCVENGKAVRVPVQIGQRFGSRIELVRKQTKPARRGEPAVWERLSGTEEVVVTNPATLKEGQVVRLGTGKPGEVARMEPRP